MGKSPGVGCHFLVKGNLPDPGIKPASLASPAPAGRFTNTPAARGLGLEELREQLARSSPSPAVVSALFLRREMGIVNSLTGPVLASALPCHGEDQSYFSRAASALG